MMVSFCCGAVARTGRPYFKKNEQHIVCPWKGVASYYDIEVNGQVNKGAAWYYATPSDAAAPIKKHVAFWNGVKVEADPGETQLNGGGLMSALKRLLGA